MTEQKEADIKEKIIVIGKVLENKKFEFKIDSDDPLSIIGDLKEDDRVRSYLQLIIEIYNYFENTTGSKIIINIPDLFTTEIVMRWIDMWKENDFYIDPEKKTERPNRDLLLIISKLKEQSKREIHILFNYRL